MSIEIPKDFILFLIAGLLAQVVDSQNPIPSRLKTVQDSPIPKTACVDGKITSMICLTSHVMQVATDTELQHDADQATPDADSHTDPLTSHEVELCLKRLKNRRAPGICFITAELLKKGGDSMIKWLAYIINIVWIKKTIPDDWRRGIILHF